MFPIFFPEFRWIFSHHVPYLYRFSTDFHIGFAQEVLTKKKLEELMQQGDVVDTPKAGGEFSKATWQEGEFARRGLGKENDGWMGAVSDTLW